MTKKYLWFIRIGLVLIGIGGFIFAIGDAFIPQDGNMFSATKHPNAFADLVISNNFELWALRGLIGVPLETIGTLALFFGLMGTAKEKWGFWGMLLCVLGDLFGISIFVLAYYIFPEVGYLILNGVETASSIAAIEPMIPLIGTGFLFTFIGLFFFAVSIWNAPKRFPKWSGIMALIGFLLLLVQTSYIIQIVANIIWGSAYLWMAGYSWNRIAEV